MVICMGEELNAFLHLECCQKCESKRLRYYKLKTSNGGIQYKAVCQVCGYKSSPLKQVKNIHKRNSNDFTAWAYSVKSRDEFRCRDCGATENIEAHHIVPVQLCKGAKEPLKFDVDNGITLCHECHCKRHPTNFKMNPQMTLEYLFEHDLINY